MNSQHDPGWQAGNGCNKDCFCMLFAFLINHLTVRQTPASAAHKSDFTQRETLKEGASGQEGSVQFKCRLAWTWSLCDRWLRVSVCVWWEALCDGPVTYLAPHIISLGAAGSCTHPPPAEGFIQSSRPALPARTLYSLQLCGWYSHTPALQPWTLHCNERWKQTRGT